MKMKHKPFVLVICDGWGENPNADGNAIDAARTPALDQLRREWVQTVVAASGEAVGLPEGQMGNSEVGHLTIGTGRIIRQALVRQLHEIKTGAFYENEQLITAIETAKQRGTDLHIMGLVSPGDVHSHTGTALATAKLAKQLGLDRVHVHAFTDGRDTPPASARKHIEAFEKELVAEGIGHIASISGRYYSMDRDNRWDRIEQAYRMLVDEEHPSHPSATGYIEERYKEGEYDEFLKPVSIAANPSDRATLKDGDVVVFFNFRPDRARQLTRALVDVDFKGFKRTRVVKDLYVVTIAEYERELPVTVAFPREDVTDSLAEVVSRAGLKQFHTAETEKYAHVTYYINGGQEKAFPGEDRLLIPSPKVATYDLVPEMSAVPVADAAIDRVSTGDHDLVIVNFANADMVGHTGDFDATVKAIEILDACLGRLADAAIAHGGAVLITADHGNAEIMHDDQKQPVTAHSTSPVPVILCGTDAKTLRAGGGLQDIAPTVLDVMGLEKPAAMTGRSLTAD
jgi:2,3-bisphosphoglycerate-independent phosphoglycerate mutase